MARNPHRIGRATAVSEAIEGRNGWSRDPYEAGVIAEWRRIWPDLPVVADGREETGFTRAGRGTTAFDLFRTVEVGGGVLRSDFLSLKTDTIGSDGKLPSKLELSTGNEGTLRALLAGIESGGSLYTLVFASVNDEDGNPSDEGFALFLDLAPILRAGIAGIESGPYAKGQAPEAYFKWSSARPCGGKAKHLARADRTFPYVDEQGRKWIAADKVCYPELIVSLASLGIKRSSWIPCRMSDLPGMLETQDWGY